MASINTRLNIEKLNGNIVQKHGDSKQVVFTQLGPGVETGFHGVHDEKRVWFEVELQRAQGDREAEVFQVSNDDTAVDQRRLEDKSTQHCMKSEVAKHLGVAGIQQQTELVDETNVTHFAKVRCFLIQSGLSKVFRADDTTRSTYLVNRSPSSAIGFKNIVGNKLWRLDDVISKVLLYKNIGFNESEEYKKTFIGSGVGMGSVQVLQGVEFEVKPQEDHTFEVEPHGNFDHVVGSQEVQTQDLIYYHSARDREQHSAWELFSYREDSNETAFAVVVVDKIYAQESLNFNNTVACDAEIRVTKGLLVKAKGNILGLEITKDQSDNTLRVSQSRIYNENLIQTLLKGNSTLSLNDSLSGDYVGMLDKFDCGLQTDVHVFVDFDYAMGRSITVMGRSITKYGLRILGCEGSLKANLQHMEALSTTEARYMTFTKAWKKEIWLKGLLIESRYELRLVAGIATGALVKDCPCPRFQHRSKWSRIANSEYESAFDERIFELRYPAIWTRVYSKRRIHVENGIQNLSCKYAANAWLGPYRQMKKVIYYYVVAHFRLDEFSKSAECVDRCLEIQPNYLKALNLKKIIEARVRRDGVYNKIINGATNIGVVTIALETANKLLYRRRGN
ncbi:zinc finger, CCHC-type containing protein [Tanacetum coccineum]